MDEIRCAEKSVPRWRAIKRFLIVAVFVVVGIPPGTVRAGTASDLLFTYPVFGNPLNLTVAGLGDIWYTLPDEGSIERLIVTSPGVFSTERHPLSMAGSQPYDIAYGAGAVWFTERGANRIGKIDVETGKLDEYEIPVADSQPTGIDVDASGIVWFVTSGSNHVVRFDPDVETFKMYAYERDGAQLEDVSARHSGALWLTAPGVNRAVKFDKGNLSFEEVLRPPQGSIPYNIVVSGGDVPWITSQGRGELAFFLAGTLSIWLSLPYITDGGHPIGLDRSMVDDVERIWFTDGQNNLVGQFVIRGNSMTGPFAANVNSPAGIAVDDQGNAWIAVADGIVVWHPPYWKNVYLPVIHR